MEAAAQQPQHRADDLERRLAIMEERLDKMESLFGLANMEERLDNMEALFGDLSDRLKTVEEAVEEARALTSASSD